MLINKYFTHSVDNLFHTLMVLWENENFNIQSTLFLHQREVVPSSYFTLGVEKVYFLFTVCFPCPQLLDISAECAQSIC